MTVSECVLCVAGCAHRLQRLLRERSESAGARARSIPNDTESRDRTWPYWSRGAGLRSFVA